jgi:signal transduction histidine kinase
VHSIEQRLLAWILGALSIGAAVLVGVSYLVTLDEMDEVFDENLKQVALAAASFHRFEPGADPRTRIELPSLPRVYEQPDEFDFVMLTWTRDGRPRFASEADVRLPFTDVTGLAQVRSGGEDWHVYTIVLGDGVIQVAQRASSRKTLAGEAASELLPPLLLLIGLIGALLVVALRGGLRPLDRAADGVAARSVASLEPIELGSLPREIHPLIHALNGLMQRLSEAFGVQRRFVADAAHELRSPIAALRLQLQGVERAGDAADRARAVAALRAGIDRAQRLVEQLLRLSQVEPDAPVQQPRRCDLAALVREAVSLRSVEAEHQGIDLGAEAEQPVWVLADPDQLAVLLDNLVGNAIRYTPAGGRVDARASLLDGQPALQVIDNGPGIAPAERERVFERFYRGEGLQSELRLSGSGLGLAIVKAIALRHGAALSLHDGPGGRGLEVRLVLPAGGPLA